MPAIQIGDEDLKAALPDTSTATSLEGLDGPVEVLRDGYGIPHVRATTTHDAFFGQGFATAQDRLWHMDFDRRRAYGRWAELAGPSGMDQDLMMRRFRIAPTVRRDYEAVDGDTRAMLDAYTEGVNAYIRTTRVLPVEYTIVGGAPEPWAPWDCLAVFKARHIMMGVYQGKLWRARLVSELGADRAAELLPGYQEDHLLIIPPGAEYSGGPSNGLRELAAGAQAAGLLEEFDGGSNSWAVAGSRTASGKPLLAGDPHRALDTPNVYYQNQISCPDFDAIGLSFPGCPGFPHFGHNARVAWCVTHAGADYQDLYIERFMEGDSSQYEFQGDWKRAEVARETIKVRGGEPVELDVTFTHHGPVIAGDPSSGLGVAFKYTATAGTNLGIQSMRAMLTAGSADEMEESMRDWVDPCNNFMYIDTAGDIGYLNRGQVPIRSAANGWLPVPGWTGEHEWEGSIPFEDLARSRNPDAGYIVTANNRIVDADYPYYIALDFAPEHRARRILGRLESIQGATIEDMASVHAERVSNPAVIYARLLAGVQPADDLSARAQSALAGWDGSMERDGVAPTIYSAFRMKLNATLFEHLLGRLAAEAAATTGRGGLGHLMRLSAWFAVMADRGDTSVLPSGAGWSAVAATALSAAAEYLKGRMGDDVDSWVWGKIHFTQPRHMLTDPFPELGPLLDPPSVPMGGDGDTPQQGGFAAGNPFVMTGMSVARYAFDAADWDNSQWVSPLGASGHPGSPHYADQTPIWAEVQMLPMLYSRERVEADAESRQELSPA